MQVKVLPVPPLTCAPSVAPRTMPSREMHKCLIHARHREVGLKEKCNRKMTEVPLNEIFLQQGEAMLAFQATPGRAGPCLRAGAALGAQAGQWIPAPTAGAGGRRHPLLAKRDEVPEG